MSHRRIVPILARGGYAARGVVFLIVGVFAVLAAVGGGETGGSEDALRGLLGQPFGGVLVAIMAVALLGFSAWRIAQSVFDADDHGLDARGAAVRVGLLASAVTYLGLAVFSVGLLIGSRLAGDGGGTGGDWLSALLGQEWSRWAAIIAAAVVAGVGVAHLVKAARAGFEKYLDADAETMRYLSPVCRFGLAARGVVFLVVAAMIFTAGRLYGPEDAPGTSEALDAIQGLPFGWLLLLIIAAGLVAFGAYSLIEAVYRRVTV